MNLNDDLAISLQQAESSKLAEPHGTMKILHALVGYLAATTLASHPFAFASPLRLAAIDFDSDGYVKTQNYKDSALMKRVSGDIIETRQSEVVIPLAFIVTDIIAGIILKLVLSNDDDDVRG